MRPLRALEVIRRRVAYEDDLAAARLDLLHGCSCALQVGLPSAVEDLVPLRVAQDARLGRTIGKTSQTC